MGAINIARLEFAATISEKVGYKSGLVLNREEMAHHVPDYEDVFLGDEDGWIRIRSEDVEQLFGNLLHAVGAVMGGGCSTSPSETTKWKPRGWRSKSLLAARPSLPSDWVLLRLCLPTGDAQPFRPTHGVLKAFGQSH